MNDDIWKNLTNELREKNIIYRRISVKNGSEGIKELFCRIAEKYTEKSLSDSYKNKNLFLYNYRR